MTRRALETLAVILASTSVPTLAQDAAPDPATPPSSTSPTTSPATPPPAPATTVPPAADGAITQAVRDWTIEVNPRLWWVSPSGDLTLPGGSGEVRIEDLNLDTPQFTPAGSLAINAGDFRFNFFGSSYSRDAEFVVPSPLAIGSISLLPTGPSEASFDLGIYEVSLGYRFLRHDFKARSRDPKQSADLVLDLYGLAGARLYDLNIDVSQPGTGTASADEFFIEPIIGVRSELAIIRDFSVNLQLDAGGFGDSDRSSFSFNIAVDFQWRPAPWIGVQIGWRQVLYSFEDGDDASKFEYDGAMAGLFTGVVFRF